jgi:hypothetical protein
MKRTAPLTLTFIAALVLTGCAGSTEAGSEPSDTATRKSAEEWQMQRQAERKAEEEAAAEASPTERKQLSDYNDDERNFLADLANLRTELDNEELVEAGLVTCYQIELTKDEDTVTGSDISDRTFSYMANYENDADNSYEVVRAAVYNFCPELVDQFDYEAMRSLPFYDDFIDERGAWRDDEIREEIENAQ